MENFKFGTLKRRVTDLYSDFVVKPIKKNDRKKGCATQNWHIYVFENKTITKTLIADRREYYVFIQIKQFFRYAACRMRMFCENVIFIIKYLNCVNII